MTVRDRVLTIGIDARAIYSPRRRGTGKNLLDVYRVLARQRPAWRFVMFDAGIANEDPFDDVPNIERITVNIPGYRWNLWQDVRLPLAVRARDIEVLHCPANVMPYWRPSPTLLTIHDLIQLKTPTDGQTPRWWSRRLRRSAEQADRIVVPSRFTAMSLNEELGVPLEKITVNHWAPDRGCQRVESQAEIDRVVSRYGVKPGQRYVLVFGADDPRKNTVAILKAWDAVQAELGPDVVMLVIGLQPQALERLKALHLTPPSATVFHGFVDEEDMPSLLSGAATLCYASLAEGFGLPLLDAFVCRTPVITSSTTSLPEVAGEAARLVDPRDVSSIAAGLRDVLTSAALRDRLVSSGARRLEAFSWERCADTLAGALEASVA